MPDLPTDCNTLNTALTAAALAIATTSVAVCAFTLAYITKVLHEWRTWRI